MCYKLCNTYYKLCNKRYKLCNKNYLIGQENVSYMGGRFFKEKRRKYLRIVCTISFQQKIKCKFVRNFYKIR